MSTAALGGLVGLMLIGFGLRMLIRGQAPAMIGHAFRSVRDAGYYHLLFGLALVVYLAGVSVDDVVLGQVAAVLAVALVGFALVRFRPRGRGKRHREAPR
ncbi:hypothetical protein [Actinoplanes sp. NPDC051851]|uniref:hypothetical protein n=1 Tax=Actinoplanes sp. NPDC051851 TaxID=3154753 RepID=UPI00342E9F1F